MPTSSSSSTSVGKTVHQNEDIKRLQSLPPLSPSSFNLPASSSSFYKQPHVGISPEAFPTSTTTSSSSPLQPLSLSPSAADAESRLLPWELEKLSKQLSEIFN